jgi:hypothetical protein
MDLLHKRIYIYTEREGEREGKKKISCHNDMLTSNLQEGQIHYHETNMYDEISSYFHLNCLLPFRDEMKI